MAMLVQLLEKFNSEQFDLLAVNLQRILYSHFRRIGQFHKALITIAFLQDYDYEEDDTHRACAFGQWYYSQAAPEIEDNKEFIELGKIHEDLHAAMRDLLRKTRNDGPITADDYDRFLKTYNLFTDKLLELITEINFAQYQFDPLTKLLNRRVFEKSWSTNSIYCKEISGCTVAMADIDYFKNVNDTYGHAVGDTVLKGLAELFLKQLRGYDTVSRFGGEEFIFCPPTRRSPPLRKSWSVYGKKSNKRECH
jgi:GGDEF domain-containing protein